MLVKKIKLNYQKIMIKQLNLFNNHYNIYYGVNMILYNIKKMILH